MGYSKSDVAAPSPLATGGLSYAPKGTPLPTTATGTLDSAFKRLGLIGEDGLRPSGDAASRTDLRVWGGELAARVTENKSVTRFDFDLVSIMDPDVAKFVYGTSNVTVVAADADSGTKLSIMETGEDIADCVLVADMMFEGKRLRIVIPEGDPEITAELAFTTSSLSGWSCTVTAEADDDGNRTYRYYENDNATG